MGSWLPVVAATTNQPFGMHLKLLHVLANSSCLPPSFGVKVFLNPKVGVRFWFGRIQGSSILSNANLTTLFAFIHYFHDTIFWKFLTFISLATWYGTFYVTPYPIKRKVMSSSRSTFFLCWSSVEFFYGFLGTFHVRFIHPRCFYWMISFTLN